MDLVGRISNAGAQPVLYLSGEIDLSTLPLLLDHLTRLVHEHPRTTVRVDLDGITALDDTGLGLLLGAAARARSLSRAMPTTVAPDLASAVAVTLPMPELAPLTRQTLPFISIIPGTSAARCYSTGRPSSNACNRGVRLANAPGPLIDPDSRRSVPRPSAPGTASSGIRRVS